MTDPTQPTPPASPTGVPTLDAIIAALEDVAGKIDPALVPVIAGAADVLGVLVGVFKGPSGKELEREGLLAELFKAKDVAGLIAYDADIPAHPNESRRICRNYLSMLGSLPPNLPPLP